MCVLQAVKEKKMQVLFNQVIIINSVIKTVVKMVIEHPSKHQLSFFSSLF